MWQCGSVIRCCDGCGGRAVIVVMVMMIAIGATVSHVIMVRCSPNSLNWSPISL